MTRPRVKRRYQAVATRYQSAGAQSYQNCVLSFDIVSPLGTTLAVAGDIAKARLIVDALNAYDPEGECRL